MTEALADPATASPLLFPETVFAAPASHLAALLENTPLVSTLMGDPATFAQGLALGADWLRQDRVDVAVVVGAEEINWLRADALWHLEHAAIISGGAGAVALCRDPKFSLGVELAAVTKPQSYSARKSRMQAARAMRDTFCPNKNELLCDGLGDSPRADATGNRRVAGLARRAVESENNSGRRPHGRRRVAMRGRLRRRGGKAIFLGHCQPCRLQPAGDGRPFSGLPRPGPVGQALNFEIMDTTTALELEIKQLLIENLMLQLTAEEIGGKQPLFGPGSVGLDSVDALQIVVALDKKYGLKIQDAEAAKQILQSVHTIAEAVVQHRANPGLAK